MKQRMNGKTGLRKGVKRSEKKGLMKGKLNIENERKVREGKGREMGIKKKIINKPKRTGKERTEL